MMKKNMINEVELNEAELERVAGGVEDYDLIRELFKRGLEERILPGPVLPRPVFPRPYFDGDIVFPRKVVQTRIRRLVTDSLA